MKSLHQFKNGLCVELDAKLQVSEEFINATKGYRFGSAGFYDPYTDDIGKLYRSYSREFGRCQSFVYVDREDAPPIKIGWVFVKRIQYDDAHDNSAKSYYLQETWVTIGLREEDGEIAYRDLDDLRKQNKTD